ncbi:DNA polymerase I [uncultured Mediterranean phage]|nr:DNA polymerase I [uncultured Mediterranean phage]
MVRCFPPQDKKPSGKEIEACRPYLDSEIEKYRPKYLVALGNTPLKALSGKSGITDYSGRLVGSYKDIPVFALIHPSACLHKASNLPKFESGCKELGWLLRPAAKPKHPRVYELDPKGWVEWILHLNSKVAIAFDYETTAKQPPFGGRIRCFSASDGREAFWVDVEKHEEKAMIALDKFLRSDRPKIAHNLTYEFAWSKWVLGVEPVKMLYDTALEHYLLDENKSHALDNVAMEAFGVPNWDISPDMTENEWSWASVPMEVLGPYNALDSYWTARLHSLQWPQLSDKLKKLYKDVVRPMAKVCARFEVRGAKIDRKWAKEVDELYSAHMDGIVVKVKKRTSTKQLIKELEDEGKEFNFNSDLQKRRLFYDIVKLPVIQKTATGKPAVDADTLERLKDQHPLVAEYLDWKGTLTERTNYLQKFPTFCDEKGKVHASYNNGYVVTGRLSVKSPPMQTVPDDKLMKGMFKSRFKGGKVFSGDYKQLEICLVASEANDEAMLETIREGKSAHDLTAREIFGDRFTQDDRAIAKRINFGIVYGISPYSLSKQFNLPLEYCETIFKNFRKKRPRLFKWMDQQHNHLLEHGWVESRWGRVRRLPEIITANERDAARMLRQVGNFPIQSAGADITNMACILVDRKLRQEECRSVFFNQIHDSLIIDIHPKELDQIPPMIVKVMTDEVQKSVPWLKTTLEVDWSLEDRLGGAKEVA